MNCPWCVVIVICIGVVVFHITHIHAPMPIVGLPILNSSHFYYFPYLPLLTLCQSCRAFIFGLDYTERKNYATVTYIPTSMIFFYFFLF